MFLSGLLIKPVPGGALEYQLLLSLWGYNIIDSWGRGGIGFVPGGRSTHVITCPGDCQLLSYCPRGICHVCTSQGVDAY